MAKGDVGLLADFGVHRSAAPIEQLRNAGKLDPHARVNEAMYEAAFKLYRHYVGAQLVGVKAQDLNRIVGGGSADALVGEENWVEHWHAFRIACKLMGWSEANPHRGAGRLVVSVVCHEDNVVDAARAYIGPARTEVMMGAGMDRLREGLFALAVHWGFSR